MFRTILVPLNGSRFAETALPLASRLARGGWSRMHLMLAHQPTAALVGLGESLAPAPDLDQSLRNQEVSYLANTAADLGQAGAEPVEFCEVEGAAGPAVCQEAARLGADLVVMATHGRSAVGRFWLGSVTDYVIRHLAAPVLLVRPERAAEPRSDPAIGGILVALDFSRDSEAILEPVTALARLSQAHVTLIHAVAEPESGKADRAILAACRAQAQRRLDHLADGLRERGISVATRVATGSNPAGTLLKTFEEGRFDLLAITTRDAGSRRRIWQGTVADAVIRGAAKPVLVLRPPPAF